MAGFNEKIVADEKREKQPMTEIIRGSEAPEENKKNPFYNSYHWGMADWEANPRKLYLPDKSDEAISFAIAAHELGHLVDQDRIQPNRHDFEPTYNEEVRAWERGWQYLVKYLPEYYDNNSEIVAKLVTVKNEVEKMLMDITKTSEPFYKKTSDDKQQQRGEFLKTETGAEIKKKMDDLKINLEKFLLANNLEELLKPIDWSKFKAVVDKALIDIEADNKLNQE